MKNIGELHKNRKAYWHIGKKNIYNHNYVLHSEKVRDIFFSHVDRPSKLTKTFFFIKKKL